MAEGDFRYGGQDGFQPLLALSLEGQELIQFPDLCQAYRGVQLGDAEIVPDKGMQVRTAVSPFMVMAVVGVAVKLCIKVLDYS